MRQERLRQTILIGLILLSTILLIKLVAAVIVSDFSGGGFGPPTSAGGSVPFGEWVQSNRSNWRLYSFNVSNQVLDVVDCFMMYGNKTYVKGTWTLATKNCSFSPTPTIENMSVVLLGINGTANWTQSQAGTANWTYPIIRTNIIFLKGFNAGTTNYTTLGFDIENVWTELGAGGVGGSNLVITLMSPANNTLSTTVNQTFFSNYTYSNMNVSNATYYIWYSNNSLYNKTTVVNSAVLNETNLTLYGISLGSYKWNVKACGQNISLVTQCGWGSDNNYSIDFAGALLNENYSQTTVETASEKFQANFSMYPGTNLISVLLVYNGTPYVVSDITNYGTSVELKRTIDINTNANKWMNETKQFYWSFIFSNSGLTQQNTSLRNQTILPLNIIYCNSTYSILGLNFTTYDETNPNPLINSTFHTAWSFWAGSGTIKKNYSFEDTSAGNSSFKFCVFQNYSTIHADLDAEITSPGYWDRTYYLSNATINNVTQEVPLRMINNTLGVKFFHTIRKSVTRISNALVIISKYDVGLGAWVTVGIRQSDDIGEFIEYLELDKQYTYSISQNGIFLGNIAKTSTCSATPCTISLELSDVSPNLWTGYYDEFAPNVIYNLSYDRTTKNVTFDFIDTSGLAQYFRLQVNKLSSNDTGILICNDTLHATLGQLKCDLSTETGQFIAKTYVSRSPEKFIASLYGILDSLAETIGKNEGLLFALIIVIIVGLIGAWNPVIGVVLAGLAFIFASIMGLIIMSFTSICLVVLLIIILVIKMGRQGI